MIAVAGDGLTVEVQPEEKKSKKVKPEKIDFVFELTLLFTTQWIPSPLSSSRQTPSIFDLK